jgi:hypothetical protein
MALEDDVRQAAEQARRLPRRASASRPCSLPSRPPARASTSARSRATRVVRGSRSTRAAKALTNRAVVREAVSLLALCEIAEEAAEIEVVHPRLATPAYLDSIGTPDVAASMHAVDALLQDVESAYKQELT